MTTLARPVPILTYHSLDASGSVISVAPDAFREHMHLLRDKRFVGIRLDQLLEAWAGRGALPQRPVVLTFDDGFANVLEHAAPVLSELGFGATVFVVTEYCGRTNDWPGQGPEAPRLPLLSWDALQDLVAAGVEIGAHSANHPRLTRLAGDEARDEIVACKRTLEDRLGGPVRSFAYPYGDTSPAVLDVVREHYLGACGVSLGTARPTDDGHLLPRIDAYYVREPATLRLLGTVRGGLYLGLRALGRRVRGRLTRD